MDWKEKAREVESRLTALAREIPGVTECHGSSEEGTGEFRIHVRVANCNLSLAHDSDTNTLESWSLSTLYELPEAVRAHIGERFPHARYDSNSAELGTVFHYWHGVTEEQLPR